MNVDRGDAVNLARNVLEVHNCKGVTEQGVKVLAKAVMAMDAALTAAPAAVSAPSGYCNGVMAGNIVRLRFDDQDSAEAWFMAFCDAYDAAKGTTHISLPIPSAAPQAPEASTPSKQDAKE